MKQKVITRLDHCQCLRVTQESYPLSHYAKPHLIQNLVAQISDNRIYNLATDGKRTLDHLNAMLSPTIEHNPIFDKTRPVQLSKIQYNRQ
ncbi:hypothetical protein HG533_02930 [Moraxella osloensis]|nr:hypothetical protein [Moraxella osloensis]MBW4017765.1 hypothetical protein [Moraxella osloensis]